jgi:nickel-dependent lactate racemase
MVIQVEYGNDRLSFNLPGSAVVDILERPPINGVVSVGDFEEILDRREGELFPISEAGLYVVNDGYRPTPSALILNWISGLGRLNEKARFLIATGCHKAPDERHLKRIFGSLYQSLRDRILIHDAYDAGSLVEIGKDVRGEPVFINKAFHQAEKVVVIGSVEPHYFAGYTGGRKAVFPGLGDFRTTVRNHGLAVSFEAAPMKLETNPVEEHLQSLMHLVAHKKIFGIQVVLGADDEIAHLSCGRLADSFEEVKDAARRTYGIQLRHKYDLLLAEVRPPLDSNLYQLQKSLENCQAAVADKGNIILFSPCREGVGSDAFYRLAANWNPGQEARPASDNDFGIHKLYRVNKIGQRIGINLFSDLPEGIPERVFFHGVSKPQGLLDRIMETQSSVKVALVRDAGHTVLVNCRHL